MLYFENMTENVTQPKSLAKYFLMTFCFCEEFNKDGMKHKPQDWRWFGNVVVDGF